MPRSTDRPSPRPRAARARTRAARAGLDRDLILAAAEREFAERGFEGARMQQVAAAAGVSLKTLYARFRGKRALYDAVRETRRDELFETLGGSARNRSPRERLLDGTRAVVEFLAAHPDFLRVQLRDVGAWAFEPRGPGGRRLRAHRWGEVMDLQTRLIRRGQQAGELALGDPAMLARALSALVQVQLGHWLESGGPDRARLADQVVELAERLLCSPRPTRRGIPAL